MEKDQKDMKKSLEQQLQWTKKQMHSLDEMDVKLHEMKRIAEYALAHSFLAKEIELLNNELNTLKSEHSSLEKQLYPVLH